MKERKKRNVATTEKDTLEIEKNIANTKYDEDIYLISTTSTLSNIKVIGYEGNLGEYEKINVPECISWGVDSTKASSNLTITELGFHSSADSDATGVG